MGANSLPKTVTRQRRDCDLNPGPSAPESVTRLPSHPPCNCKAAAISTQLGGNHPLRHCDFSAPETMGLGLAHV